MTGNSIDGALPGLVFAYGELQAKTRPLNIVWQIAQYGGLRTQADTVKIMAYRDNDYAVYLRDHPNTSLSKDDFRPIAEWGRSMHNYGAAFDVEIVSAPHGMSKLEALNIVKDLALECDLIDGRDFGDPPHCELRFYTVDGAPIPPGTNAINAAKQAWQAQTGTNFFTGDSVSIIGVVIVVCLIGYIVWRKRHV